MGNNCLAITTLQQIILLSGGAAFLMALSTGSILTALMCRISWRMGVVDRPDGFLKCHDRPTATLGGIPLFISIALTVAIICNTFNLFPETGPAGIWFLVQSHLEILLALLVILLLGITDDINRIRPRSKLLFQIIAAGLIIASGLVISNINFFGVYQLSLGILAVPFTLFWLVGSCTRLTLSTEWMV